MKKIFGFLLAFVLCLATIPTVPAQAAHEEAAWFPAYTMNLSQLAYEGYSHGEQNAIDILPNGNVFAPFSGKIVYTDKNWGYVVLQSKDKVNWADGSVDYMTVGFMHDEDIGDLYVGKELTQGEEFYQAGGMGNGNPNAYGDHVHITVHRGHVTRGYPYGTGDEFAFNALFLNPEFTTEFAGRGKGILASGNKIHYDAPTDYGDLWVELDSYLAKCDSYPSCEKVKITRKTTIKSLPCSKKTDERSLDIVTGTVGDILYTTGIYKNTAGNYWYRVNINGTTGYLYSGDTAWQGTRNDLAVEGLNSPSTLNRGDRFSVKGNFSTNHSRISLVAAWISGSDNAVYYHKQEDLNCSSYTLLNSSIDMAMLFNELPRGNYTYHVFVETLSYFVGSDGKLVEQATGHALTDASTASFSVR